MNDDDDGVTELWQSDTDYGSFYLILLWNTLIPDQ